MGKNSEELLKYSLKQGAKHKQLNEKALYAEKQLESNKIELEIRSKTKIVK